MIDLLAALLTKKGELMQRMKNTQDFQAVVNGQLDPDLTSIAGILPPMQMRTGGFWSSLMQKVVGSASEPGQNNWRWMADFNGQCSGSIISSELVLTSAMCCLLQKSNYVYLGGFGQRKSGLRRVVVERNIHPEFDQSLLRNDVCLVKLKSPVPFGPNIQPICLPPAGNNKPAKGSLLYTAGWGSISVPGGSSKTMTSGKLPVIPFDSCENQYKKLGLELDKYAHFCVMKNAGGVGPCRGDWGSPAVLLDDAGNSPGLFGLASFARGCSSNSFASVYVNVSPYVDWINETGKIMQGLVETTTTRVVTTTTTTTASTPAYTGYLSSTDIDSCSPGWDSRYSTSSVGSALGSRMRGSDEQTVAISSSDPYGLYDDDYPEWDDDYSEWDNSDHQAYQAQAAPSMATMLGRIKGGKAVIDQATWPFAIRIETPGSEAACAATLIGKRWALTAAHCCVPGIMQNGKLFLGKGNLYRSVVGSVRYPGFNVNNYNHNICVVKLNDDVMYTDEVQPACLSEDIDAIDAMQNDETYIAGFGTFDGKASKGLREAAVRVVSNHECESELPPNWLKTTMFCATGYYQSHDIDTCKGHSGGPHVQVVDGKPVLTGIISWGNGCVKERKYSLYTGVAHYTEFIKYAINQLETGITIPYSPGMKFPDEVTLRLSTATYACPKPLDTFLENTYAPIPAENDWPWLVNIHHQCFGVLVGASQIVTAASCCKGQLKGKYTYNNARRRMIFDHRINKDLCLIQLNNPFNVNPKTFPICLNEGDHSLKMFVKSLDQNEYQMDFSNKQDCGMDHGKDLEDYQFCGTEYQSAQCKLGPGAAAVSLNESGVPVLSGIYIGGENDNTCDMMNTSTGVFSDIRAYSGWLRSAAQEMSGYHKENYVKPTKEQLAAFKLSYQNARTECNNPFTSVQIKAGFPGENKLFMGEARPYVGPVTSDDEFEDLRGEGFEGFEGFGGFDTGFDASFFDSGNADRIMGGEVITNFDEWSFLANLDNKCSGAFIGGRFVVTAAHCCIGDNTGASVSFGNGVQTTVSRFWSHSEFDVETFAHDVCILELAHDLTDYGVDSICLRELSLHFSTAESISPAFIAGYGKTETTSNAANSATVAILSQTECERAYGDFFSSNEQFCAGFSDGGVDSCSADTGGPLVTVDMNGVRELAGIFVFGQGCNKGSNAPGVYLNLRPYTGWIYDTIAASLSVTGGEREEGSREEASREIGLMKIKETQEYALPDNIDSMQCPSTYDSSQANIINKLNYEVMSRQDGFEMASWPFAVNVQKACSGALISQSAIVTSAGCCSIIDADDINNWRVNMGSERAMGERRVRIASRHMHPHYWRSSDGSRAKNDICIIKLDRTIDYNQIIQPVCLGENNPSPNAKLFTAGWATPIGGKKEITKLLDERVMSAGDVDSCDQQYIGRLHEDQFCAKRNRQEYCYSDIGGPIVEVINGKPLLVGLVTINHGCPESGTDGYQIATSISHHRLWMDSGRFSN